MKFHEWGEQYGPIYQVNLAGVNHVWITRDNIARDLLTKRGAIYSNRPHIPALERDNRTSGQYLPLMSKNETWTRQRRFAKQIMDTSEKQSFYGYPELESLRLMVELMVDPFRYNVAMESYISRVTSRLAWGTSAPSDELKQRARELLIGVSPSGALGNKFPFIMSLPERLIPAKAWESRRARTERKFFQTMQQQVKSDMSDSDTPKPSWMRAFLENKLKWGFASDLEGAFAVGMHGIAGALTIAAPMQSFCLAMCHYPQYQDLLYEEIDEVLGDRMPTFADMPDMPVLRAFIRETLRWRPPVPTGIPHESSEDDVYEGYHIPAGSVIHPLEWSISRDPDVFPEPDEWNPLRWLDQEFPTFQEPLTKFPTITQYSQFGYGRRTCQGMGVTEADLFVGLGSVAWLFSMQANDSPEPVNKPATSDAEAEAESWLQEQVKYANQRAEDEALSEAEADAQIWLQEQMKTTNERADFEETAPRALQERRAQASEPLGDSQPPRCLSSEDAERGFFEHNAKRIKRESWDSKRRSTSQDFSTLQHAIAAKLANQNDLADQSSRPSSLTGTPPPPQLTARISEYDRVEQAVTKIPLPFSWHHANDSGICLPETPLSTPGESESVSALTPPTSPSSTRSVRWSCPPPAEATPETTPDSAPKTCTTTNSSLQHPPSARSTKLRGTRPSTAPIHGKVAMENDPTMDFSTLLIAKPMPFSFQLRIRDESRAEKVQKRWLELKLQGKFEEAKVYWGKTTAGDAEVGWGKTFS